MTYTVILAEDSSEIRLLMRYMLEHDGRFTIVAEASNGHEAVELASEMRPDAIVLDLAMPKSDGFSAIPALRQASPNTKILVFLALPHDEVADAVRNAGANGFLQKPIGARSVASKLADLCSA